MGRRTPLTLSLDLDGTLTDLAFAEGVWLDGVPALLARKQGLDMDETRRFCAASYAAEGDDSLRWYTLPHWLERFGLDVDAAALINDYLPRITLFDDVLPTLEHFRRRGATLLIFSNATRLFLDAEVRCGKLAPYFERIISLPDDWGMLKAETASFERLRRETSGELVHVGDHVQFDYAVPLKAGIDAYHVWRGQGARVDASLSSLEHLSGLLDAA